MHFSYTLVVFFACSLALSFAAPSKDRIADREVAELLFKIFGSDGCSEEQNVAIRECTAAVIEDLEPFANVSFLPDTQQVQGSRDLTIKVQNNLIDFGSSVKNGSVFGMLADDADPSMVDRSCDAFQSFKSCAVSVIGESSCNPLYYRLMTAAYKVICTEDFKTVLQEDGACLASASENPEVESCFNDFNVTLSKDFEEDVRLLGLPKTICKSIDQGLGCLRPPADKCGSGVINVAASLATNMMAAIFGEEERCALDVTKFEQPKEDEKSGDKSKSSTAGEEEATTARTESGESTKKSESTETTEPVDENTSSDAESTSALTTDGINSSSAKSSNNEDKAQSGEATTATAPEEKSEETEGEEEGEKKKEEGDESAAAKEIADKTTLSESNAVEATTVEKEQKLAGAENVTSTSDEQAEKEKDLPKPDENPQKKTEDSAETPVEKEAENKEAEAVVKTEEKVEAEDSNQVVSIAHEQPVIDENEESTEAPVIELNASTASPADESLSTQTTEKESAEDATTNAEVETTTSVNKKAKSAKKSPKKSEKHVETTELPTSAAQSESTDKDGQSAEKQQTTSSAQHEETTEASNIEQSSTSEKASDENGKDASKESEVKEAEIEKKDQVNELEGKENDLNEPEKKEEQSASNDEEQKQEGKDETSQLSEESSGEKKSAPQESNKPKLGDFNLVNPGKSCEDELKSRTQTEMEDPDVWVPRCDAEGLYKDVQCKQIGFCWCADNSQGDEVPDSRIKADMEESTIIECNSKRYKIEYKTVETIEESRENQNQNEDGGD